MEAYLTLHDHFVTMLVTITGILVTFFTAIRATSIAKKAYEPNVSGFLTADGSSEAIFRIRLSNMGSQPIYFDDECLTVKCVLDYHRYRLQCQPGRQMWSWPIRVEAGEEVGFYIFGQPFRDSLCKILEKYPVRSKYVLLFLRFRMQSLDGYSFDIRVPKKALDWLEQFVVEQSSGTP